MVLGGLFLALRLRGRRARVAWLALLIAGVTNALVVSLVPTNLININLVHHFLGAKYSFSYNSFYQLINAARERPQVNMRDLERPPEMLRSDPRERRAYYIDLMREAGVEFDPLAPLAVLDRRAQETDVIHSEAVNIMKEYLQLSQIRSYRSDALLALNALSGREITTDYGYNGSPFYSLVRRADPTLHRPFGRGTAWFNLILQIAAALLLVWLTGAALRVELNERLAMAALLFASWDFVGWALPGLIFAGLWLPVAIALFAFSRRAAIPAGVAIAWAGLIKVFPFILLLPVGVGTIRSFVRQRGGTHPKESARWLLVVMVSCVTAALVLGFASTLSGRSWFEFLQKIIVQFQSKAFLLNSVSLSQGLFTLGVHGSPLPSVLSLVALGLLSVLFLRSGDKDFVAALPRRSLVLLAATGWLLHTWFNYYTIAPLLLLPLIGSQHRAGAAIAAAALAMAYVLPEFDDPYLLAHPPLFALKVAPYVLIPVWLAALEFRDLEFGGTAKRVGLVVVAVCCALMVGETVRMQMIERLDRVGGGLIDRGEARDALGKYQRLVKLAPRNAMAHMNTGIALAMLERNQEAGAEFARAVELDPRSEHARQNYGRWLLNEGRLEEAAAELEAARRLVPFDDMVLFDLALARLRLGHRDEASALLVRALELQPENRTVKNLLTDIQGD
jgi:tetratricopeptide (TPR) repeat protein